MSNCFIDLGLSQIWSPECWELSHFLLLRYFKIRMLRYIHQSHMFCSKSTSVFPTIERYAKPVRFENCGYFWDTTRIFRNIHTYIHIYIYALLKSHCIQKHLSMYVCMYVCMYAYIYIYIYTYVYVYIPIHMYVIMVYIYIYIEHKTLFASSTINPSAIYPVVPCLPLLQTGKIATAKEVKTPIFYPLPQKKKGRNVCFLIFHQQLSRSPTIHSYIMQTFAIAIESAKISSFEQCDLNPSIIP